MSSDPRVITIAVQMVLISLFHYNLMAHVGDMVGDCSQLCVIYHCFATRLSLIIKWIKLSWQQNSQGFPRSLLYDPVQAAPPVPTRSQARLEGTQSQDEMPRWNISKANYFLEISRNGFSMWQTPSRGNNPRSEPAGGLNTLGSLCFSPFTPGDDI